MGASDAETVAAILSGDERTFAGLVDWLSPAMLRVAASHGVSEAVAEEVVQETWLAVLRSLRGFEGRSSLRTWIMVILVNGARRRAALEARSLPFSEVGRTSGVAAEMSEEDPDVDRFFRPDHPRWAGCWTTVIANPDVAPERRVLTGELVDATREAMRALPPAQQTVFRLRDVEGWPAAEVCEVLGISEGNQRVLLHRGRTKVRKALERYLEGDESPRGATRC